MEPDTPPPQSIFRTRTLAELPVALVTDVAAVVDIAELRLTVAGHTVTLTAGELREEWDGTLRVEMMDESILIQVDGRSGIPIL